MPYLRFTRDRRGYENTFLVHTVQRRGKQQARVLYWFRSPPEVKVGRAALDEEAIRELEARHPEITFVWNRILQAKAAEHEEQAPPPARHRESRGGSVNGRDARGGAAPAHRREAPPPRTPAPEAEPSAMRESPAEETRPVLQPSAALQALGSEELARLRGRYAEVQARITQHTSGGAGDIDAATVADLRSLAERLNPDAWVTAGEVRSGVDEFGHILGELRRRLGWPRRRARGGRKHRSARAAATGDASAEAPGDGAAPLHSDEPAD